MQPGHCTERHHLGVGGFTTDEPNERQPLLSQPTCGGLQALWVPLLSLLDLDKSGRWEVTDTICDVEHTILSESQPFIYLTMMQVSRRRYNIYEIYSITVRCYN